MCRLFTLCVKLIFKLYKLGFIFYCFHTLIGKEADIILLTVIYLNITRLKANWFINNSADKIIQLFYIYYTVTVNIQCASSST